MTINIGPGDPTGTPTPAGEPEPVTFVTVHVNGTRRVGIRTGTQVWLLPPNRPAPRVPFWVILLVSFAIGSIIAALYIAVTSPDHAPAPPAAAEAPLHPAPIPPAGPGKDWRRGDH